MPLHVYECSVHGEHQIIREMQADNLQVFPCPDCGQVMQKIWRMDTIPSVDTVSARACDPYYNEQLGKVVRKNRELEDCQPMIEERQAAGQPFDLDWK